MQYYNVHTHTFTMSNAPERFLHLYLPPFLANMVDRITETQAGSWAIQKILNACGGNGGKRYASFLHIGKSKNQQEVFTGLLSQYKDDATMKFVALTMNMENCGAGPSLSGFEGQLEEILALKKQYPEQLLVFLGIDPRWKYDGATLRQTVETYFNHKLPINEKDTVFPFVGLKIYPSMGFYPFDPRLKEVFEWAAEHKVPVLSHCSFLGGLYNNDTEFVKANLVQPDPYNNYQDYPSKPISYQEQGGFGRWIMGRKEATNNLNRCSYFMEPAAFDSLMGYFQNKGKPLKMCLAHFGGGNQILATDPHHKTSQEDRHPYGDKGINWFEQVKAMMKKYPSLYTDIAYALYDSDVHPLVLTELDNPVYGNRILFGTDFFMTEREKPEKDDYSVFKTAARKWTGCKKAWDKIAGENTREFLKSDYYDGS